MDEYPLVSAYKEGAWEGVNSSLPGLSLEEQIKGLNSLMIHLRWQEKDLPGIARAAGLAEQLIGYSEDEGALGSWKAVCFNRAAFFWRGWGDEDIEISKTDEAASERFAHLNLELGLKLGRRAVPIGRAEWLVGAFAWSRGDKDEAKTRFERSVNLVQEGDDPLEVKMVEAYVNAVSGEDNSALLAELDAAEKGEFYATQVRNATRILG